MGNQGPDLSEERGLIKKDYILELVLYNEIAWADGSFTPSETKTITRFVPVAMRMKCLENGLH